MLLAWFFTVAWSGAPYLMAALRPPPGTAFTGFFYYNDDHYNYLSYVEQAERGAFLFTNKLVLKEHAAALVNLEWWLVGRLSWALGGHPLIAYRIFGALAALGLLLALDHWLVRGGLPETHRLPALLLVTTGGGFGGLLWSLGGRAFEHCLDIYSGLFPFLGLLANPHFTAGTALLLTALALYDRARSAGTVLAATAVGTALALVRPYDVVMLVVVRGLVVLSQDPKERWLQRLAPLAGLAPAAAYLYWLFYRNPSFAFYPEARYWIPPAGDFAWALGPALLAALALYSRSPRPEAAAGPGGARSRAHFVAWLAMALAIIVVRPVHFSLQFLVGVGAPLLVLLAMGLARFDARATLLAACLLATSAATVVRFVSVPGPRWFVPAERLLAGESLAGTCSPRDVFFAPPDIGLYAAGFSACRAWVSHAITPGYEERTRRVEAFYVSYSPRQRAEFLGTEDISHVLLPGDAGLVPEAWLGPGTPFRRLAVIGKPPATLSVYRRPPASTATPNP